MNSEQILNEKDPQILRDYLGQLSDEQLDNIRSNYLVAITGEHKVPATIPHSKDEILAAVREIQDERKG